MKRPMKKLSTKSLSVFFNQICQQENMLAQHTFVFIYFLKMDWEEKEKPTEL